VIDELRVREWRRWLVLDLEEAEFVSRIPARNLKALVRAGQLKRVRIAGVRKFFIATSSLEVLLGAQASEPADVVPLRPDLERKLGAVTRRTG
jgi:hypothetical protein